mmetsp:Transcript_49094/g.88781  ORF Transcript_49094/g.88781 Transcript_49094/m.88781 type:complete len:215 (+) Transcript_49094:73-717(+)
MARQLPEHSENVSKFREAFTIYDEEFRESFKTYDENDSGFLTLDDLILAIRDWEPSLSVEVLIETGLDAFEAFSLESGDELLPDFLREEILSSDAQRHSRIPSSAEIMQAFRSREVGSVDVPAAVTINIKLLALSGAELTSLAANSAMTVGQLQGRIERLLDVPAFAQTLVFSGAPLAKSESLATAGLFDGAEVTLIRRPQVMVDYNMFLKIAT